MTPTWILWDRLCSAAGRLAALERCWAIRTNRYRLHRDWYAWRLRVRGE